MVPMDDNIKSNKHSVIKQRASIDAKKNSNTISDTNKPRKVYKDTADRTAVHMSIWTVYVFFVQC
jgi:hypothetical protein